MPDFSQVFVGLGHLGTSTYWITFGAAVMIAAAAGVIPGLSAPLLMALAIPFVVFTIDDPVVGIVFLATITGVEEMLDVLPIIAMGHPGGGQVTFIEGRPLSQRGQAARALGFVYVVSAIGGVVGAVVLLLAMPVLKPIILSFGFGEIGAMGLFGVALVGALSRGAMIKGLAAGLLGILLSTVGTDPFTGTDRYTLGSLQLDSGLPLIAMTVGLFALPEMMDLTMTRRALASSSAALNVREVFAGAGLALSKTPLIIRHSILGVMMGAIPGVGSRVVSWLSYGVGIALSKDKSQFGKGSFDGLVFSESVQSSKEGGQAIPTLAMGIPGGFSWAFVLVAMVAYGISPGPPMLTRFADITTLIVVSLVLGNAALAIVGLLASGQLAKLSRIPYPLLAAAIIPLAFLSSFQDMRHWLAIPIVLGFAVVGMLMKFFRWPRPPMILGFILGSIIEHNLMSAVSIHGPVGMLMRPITITLILLSIGVGVGFAFLASKSEETERRMAEVSGSAPSGASSDPPRPAQKPQRRIGFAWRSWEHLFPLTVIVVALVFVVEAIDFPTRARSMPVMVGIGLLGLAGLQLLLQLRGVQSGDILDLGMMSKADEQRRTGKVLLALLGLFVLISITLGLKWAAIALALVFPAAVSGRAYAKWGLLTGALITALVIGLFDNVLFVIWPQPAVWLLLQNLFR